MAGHLGVLTEFAQLELSPARADGEIHWPGPAFGSVEGKEGQNVCVRVQVCVREQVCVARGEVDRLVPQGLWTGSSPPGMLFPDIHVAHLLHVCAHGTWPDHPA